MKDNHHKLSRKLDASPCPARPCHSPGAMSTLLALSPWPHRPFRPLKAASPAPGRDSGRRLWPALCSRHGLWTKASQAACALTWEAHEGRRTPERWAALSLRTSELGDGRVGASSWGPRRKAADGSEARGLRQAAWPHGPAGPVDISAPTPLTSVHLSDGVLTPVSLPHWQVDGERCHPATPGARKGQSSVVCGVLLRIF